ncbi:MAG: cytochrome C oxidase subunit IV family protein [Gammaproteobacteria bacterium]|nr:cytochrome C oxidase subunit IV family protein [Gammaproteobacteria bacterium]
MLFYLIACNILPAQALYISVGVLALIQFFVQVVFFLHLNSHSNVSWSLISFLFTILMVAVLIIGTMWIMYNLYEKMGMNIMAM